MSTEVILKLRIAELREALRPFAREAEQWSEEVPDYYRPLTGAWGAAAMERIEKF